jgi:hypothetical protein
MTIKEPHMLYFISLDGDKVVRLDLSHADVPQFVSELASRHPNDRLFVRQRTESEFDLFAYLEISAQGSGTESKILEDFAENAPIDWGISEGFSNKAEGTWGNVGPVPHIGKDSDWKFRTGFWPIEGISGENDKTGKNVRFSLELPFAAWPVRNATQIFGDYIVAQLGVDQICLLHLESRRIALIARGRGPIVAKPKISNKTTDSTATR